MLCCTIFVLARATGVVGGRDLSRTTVGHGPVGAVLSNTALPVDRGGHPLVTGEAHVLATPDGSFYAYFNDWGACLCSPPCAAVAPPPCVAVCEARNGTDPGPHQVRVYRTTDLESWDNLGVAFESAASVFRPHVVWCRTTAKYVMWYERYHPGFVNTSYAVAVADDPAGPFAEVVPIANTTDHVHDANVMVDDDGTAYHISLAPTPEAINVRAHMHVGGQHGGNPNSPRELVSRGRMAARTGLRIQRLSPDFLSATTEEYFLDITSTGQESLEAPVLFKHKGSYYATAGSLSCAAGGGTDVFAWKAARPLGPYALASTAPRGQIFSKETSRSQGSTVFSAFDGGPAVWLGNQWLTAGGDRARDHDLLRWAVLSFAPDGSIEPMLWADNVTILG